MKRCTSASRAARSPAWWRANSWRSVAGPGTLRGSRVNVEEAMLVVIVLPSSVRFACSDLLLAHSLVPGPPRACRRCSLIKILHDDYPHFARSNLKSSRALFSLCDARLRHDIEMALATRRSSETRRKQPASAVPSPCSTEAGGSPESGAPWVASPTARYPACDRAKPH